MAAKIARFCIAHRVAVVSVLAVITLVMLSFAVRVEIKTVFDDLMPTTHQYVKTHNKFKESFGGSNMVSIMMELDKGDIFDMKVLGKIQQMSQDLMQVKGVNQFQIISLASKKLKEVSVANGNIESVPVMWPDIPKNDEEVKKLRESVLRNPLIYGAYVSLDLKSTLITVDFYDQEVDYEAAYDQIMKIAAKYRDDNLKVRVVGEPILFGWVKHYLPETFHIFLTTVAALILLLFLFARNVRGTLLPFVAGVVSAVWALGAARLMGINFDPLIIVVAFLITARAISHSVQLVTRFDEECAKGARDSIEAATNSMSSLLKPGMLGVIADAGCMIVVILTPIPLLQKMAIIGTVWVLTLTVSAVVLTPVLLSWVKKPKVQRETLASRILGRIIGCCVGVVTGRGRSFILVGTLALFVASGLYAFKLTVGDANPGSPILWADSTYNQDSAAVNSKFRGSDRMFVVFSGRDPDALKEPEVLEGMHSFQRFMEAQPEIGGSLSIADVLPALKYTLREANPRYEELGKSLNENGELMYLYGSGTDPADLDRFTDRQYTNGSVTLFFRDHRGETIRTAVARIKEYAKSYNVKDSRIQLAGGMVGVLAAVNEVILSGQIESLALGLLVVVICCAFTYRSMGSGMLFMVPVILSNTLTFSYMAFKGIGMNINTLPVVALGIGLGVDYAFYIADGIKEEVDHGQDMNTAIAKSLNGAGKGVLITAGTLIVSVFLWRFSSLRFQAEMGIMMALWLAVSALSALFVVPALIHAFRPGFIVSKEKVDLSEQPVVMCGETCLEGRESV